MSLIVRLLGALCMIGALAGCDRQKAEAPQAPAEVETARGVNRTHKGLAAPDAVFRDPDGEDISLEEFRGVPVLVNLWASWCAPCVKELPTLDALSESQDPDGALGVIAISQDMGPQASVRAFLASHGIKTLGAYQDPDMKMTDALGAQILPMSILYDRNGREVWRFVGDLDWTGPEARALLAEAGVSGAK